MEPTAPLRRHGPDPRALRQRRWLLAALKGLVMACLLVLAAGFQPPSALLNLAKWALLGALGWGLWRAKGEALLRPLLEREVLVHEQALEVRRGGFRRFVVFEGIRHVHVVHGPRERLLSLRLDTDDDSVLLRDLEGLDGLLGAVSAAKPAACMVEVEERRVDWGEPLPWALAVLGAALLLALLAWGAWGRGDYLRANGRLLVLNGLGLGLWRPAARGQGWGVQGAEIGACALLAGMGWLMGGLAG